MIYPRSERKTLPRKLLRRPSRSFVYVNHCPSGTDRFRLICDRDMEGIVAKQASARYTSEATTWVKMKNRRYSQAAGRAEFFNSIVESVARRHAIVRGIGRL